MPEMANAAPSVAYGDWSRYFVRIVNGVRFDRSDDLAFDRAMVNFRAMLRADGALIDTSAIKTLANAT
jgi:HK97 family phage major capsid protein